MGALSYANAISLLKKTIDLLDETEKYGASAATNFDTLHDTFIAANIGDYPEACGAAVRGLRAQLAGMLTPATVRAVLAPVLAEVAAAIDAPERDPVSVLNRLRDYAIAQGTDETVNAREFSRGSPSAGGSNVGNGLIRRLTVDEDDYPLEGSYAEVKDAEVVLDQNSVDRHTEVIEFRGSKPEPDEIKRVGSGIVARMACFTTRDSERYVINPTFSQFSGTAPTAGAESTPSATTSVTGWTLTTAANARVSIDYAYRDLVGVTQTYSLRFTADNKAVQSLAIGDRRAKFSTRRPYFVQVAIYREGSCDGNTILRFGAITVTTANSTLSNGAWNLIIVPLTKSCYYKNFKENALTLEVELASRTTGSIYIDDIIVREFVLMDGSYWAAVGGSTNFLKGDTWTITDTVSATRGVVQYWLFHRSEWWRDLDGWCMPALTTGAETITDP